MCRYPGAEPVEREVGGALERRLPVRAPRRVTMPAVAVGHVVEGADELVEGDEQQRLVPGVRVGDQAGVDLLDELLADQHVARRVVVVAQHGEELLLDRVVDRGVRDRPERLDIAELRQLPGPGRAGGSRRASEVLGGVGDLVLDLGEQPPGVAGPQLAGGEVLQVAGVGRQRQQQRRGGGREQREAGDSRAVGCRIGSPVSRVEIFCGR